MKKSFSLLLFILFISCKSFSDFMAIDTKNPPNTSDDLIKGTYIMTEVNGHLLKLRFDSGATSSTINSLEVIGETQRADNVNLNKVVSVKGADGKEFSLLKFKTQEINTNTSQSLNQTLIIYSAEQKSNECVYNKSEDGLYGLNAYSNSEFPVQLDYKNNKIHILNTPTIPEGYQEIDADFQHNKIKIVTHINNKKTKLLFDTGFDGFLAINKNPFNDDPPIEIVTLLLTVNNNLSVTKQKIYFNKRINVGGIAFDKTMLFVGSYIDNGLIGLSFINHFNWIIDFQNKKLYLKKIKEFEVDESLKKIEGLTYKAMEFNNELLIASKKTSEKKYNVGDKILSVNDERITKANICEMQELLNNSSNWDDLKINTQHIEYKN